MPGMPITRLVDEPPSPAPVAQVSEAGRFHRPRILIVKLTSLGDVIKLLPVIDDIRSSLPEVIIDWAVERPCDALVALHPGIDRVIPLELRRYRKERRYAAGLRALACDIRELRSHRYDLVVDLQSRMKSALIAALAHGPVVGLACGPGSEQHYDHLYQRRIPRAELAGLDAVSAYRAQAALSCGYSLPAHEASYGLRSLGRVPAVSGTALAPKFAFLLHGSSGTEKCWPEDRWIELGCALHARNLQCFLPWASQSERERADRLAAAIPGATVPARILGLVDWVSVLASAALVV